MKISYILPGLIKIPISGLKVVYQYTDELAKLGHEVAIISPSREGYCFRDLIKAGAVKFRDWWYKIDSDVLTTDGSCEVPTKASIELIEI
ncbi:MAG: hypothetical protein H8E82_07140 [Candidatus Marinimicrobia bacterium]|nr:hypothetical protein [Candidatus Neomarinimicrobiota bacterium]